MDAQVLRSATGAAIMRLAKIGVESATLELGTWHPFAGEIVEGALLASYRFDEFRASHGCSLKTLRLQCAARDMGAVKQNARKSLLLAEAVNYAREIANQPGNVINPAALAAEAAKLARRKRLSIQVMDEKMLRAGGFGGLLAVGGGSAHPPRLIVLEHRGNPSSKDVIALVGKAITFDSGGISLKPSDKMEEMVFDKCGGIAVLGAMAAISDFRVKQNVVGIIASAENLPGPLAYRPGDIVTAFDGKNIEIINTDAEGRVVLADAIGYARKEKKARAIIDVATLTGAIGVALGEQAAGLWSNSDALNAAVMAAGAKSGERFWPMPLFAEYHEQIKSDVALVKNSAGRLGGSCTAAAFLQTFAVDTPWVHLDIAYMASHLKDRPDMGRGATGFGVRTLARLVQDWKPGLTQAASA